MTNGNCKYHSYNNKYNRIILYTNHIINKYLWKENYLNNNKIYINIIFNFSRLKKKKLVASIIEMSDSINSTCTKQYVVIKLYKKNINVQI